MLGLARRPSAAGLALALLLGAAGGLAQEAPTPAPEGAPSPGASPAPSGSSAAEDELSQALTQAQGQLARVEEELEARVAERVASLHEVEALLQANPTPELRQRQDQLQREHELATRELSAWREAVEERRRALDAEQDRRGAAAALADLERSLEAGAVRFVQADLDAARKELGQVQASAAQLEPLVAQAEARLQALQAPPAEGQGRPSTAPAEEAAVQARLAALARQRAALRARQTLLEARIQAARGALAQASPGPSAAPTPGPSAPPAADARETRLKQLLAEQQAQQARDELAEARAQLEALRARRDQAEGDARVLANDLAYWQRKLELAQRKRELGELRGRLAREEAKDAELEARLGQARAEHEAAAAERRSWFGPGGERPARLRTQAAQEREQAATLSPRVAEERAKLPLLLQRLDAVEALQRAAVEAVQQSYDFDQFQRLTRLNDQERTQARQHLSEAKLLVYALSEQVRAHQELAETWVATADLLDPPLRRYAEEHARELRAGGLVLAAFVATWIVGLVGRLLVTLTAFVSRRTGLSLSVQRFRTLQGFAQSILQVFLWVWVLIAVLGEYGVDPAKSSGAIGLIGLILAGMFQQIVVDFVKGLDILVGRHYHVGDFVEVDGQYGHVIDFNAKYTVIRSPAGQLVNVPNSRCIPSRRFPDGFVDHYVDIPLRRRGDLGEARRRLRGVCRELNERVEVVKEEPAYAEDYQAADGQGRVLRYRARVLPGSDWAVKDYFLPALKLALGREPALELAGEPSVQAINNVARFRQLFSRTLSEDEIVVEAQSTPVEAGGPPTPAPPPAPPPAPIPSGAAGSDSDVSGAAG